MVYWWKLLVRFGDMFKFVFFFNGVRVGRVFGGVDKFVGEIFGDGFGVVEGGFLGLEEIVSGGGGLSKYRVW